MTVLSMPTALRHRHHAFVPDVAWHRTPHLTKPRQPAARPAAAAPAHAMPSSVAAPVRSTARPQRTPWLAPFMHWVPLAVPFAALVMLLLVCAIGRSVL